MKLKILFICFFVTFVKGSYGQIVIDEEFNGGIVAPGGWLFTSITAILSSNSNYGKSSPSIVFDATNDEITTATFVAGTANSVTFWAQSSGVTPTTDNIVVEWFNGAVWAACTGSPFSFNTTARIIEATFPTTAVRIRIRYNRTVANLALDDVTIVNKNASCTTSSFLWFTSVNYNSCNANTCEGTDEFLTFQNGNSPFNLINLEITVPTVGTGPEGTTFCGNALNPCDEFFTTNAAYVAALNAVAGCAGFFLSPPGGIIPPNGRVIVFMGNPPSATINFATLCGSGGNYYCVFVSNTNNCTGRYSNTATTLRYTTIRDRSTGCLVERGFTPSLGSGADGDLVLFDPPGAATYVSNPGCTGFVALPINLINFWSETTANSNKLLWKVAREESVINYILERSKDGEKYDEVARLRSQNLTTEFTYEYTDDTKLYGIYYYKLSSTDANGSKQAYPVISVNSGFMNNLTIGQDDEKITINYLTKELEPKIFMYDLNGRRVKEIPVAEEKSSVIISKSTIPKGVYLIKTNSQQQPLIEKLIVF